MDPNGPTDRPGPSAAPFASSRREEEKEKERHHVRLPPSGLVNLPLQLRTPTKEPIQAPPLREHQACRLGVVGADAFDGTGA